MSVSPFNCTAVAVLATTLLATTVACGSQPTTGGEKGVTSTAPTIASASPGGHYSSPAELYRAVRQAATAQHSVTVQLTSMVGFVGGSNGSGKLRIQDGIVVAADMTMNISLEGGGRGKDRYIISSGSLFTRQSPDASRVDPGTPWLKSPVKPDKAVEQESLSMLNYMQQLTPPMALVPLRNGTSMKKVGPEALDGVDTTHYRLTVLQSKALAAYPKGVWKQMLKQRDRTRSDNIVYHVWVDAQHLPRKWTTTIGRPADSEKPSVRVSYSDWGQPVNITPPPPAKVSDLTDGWVESD